MRGGARGRGPWQKGRGGRGPGLVKAKDEDDELLRDLPEGGWIWSKPELIDDDTKVAKRVAWLNKFGHLSKPINWLEVAEPLDNLKVPHAMVLLRELEMQGQKVSDPTEWIQQAVQQAGGDHIDIAEELHGASAVEEKIAELNQSGQLAASIVTEEVKDGLDRLPEEDALGLLQEVLGRGRSVKNPTAFIRFKLKARLAVLGVSLDTPMDEHSKILKRVEWLNDYGGMLEDINYSKVAAALEKVGAESAMNILKELEDHAAGIPNPTAFILRSSQLSQRSLGATSPATPSAATSSKPSKSPKPAKPLTPMEALNSFMEFLNTGPHQKRTVKPSEVADALDALGPHRVGRILQEMREHGLGLDDPVSYIKAAAQRSAPKVKKEVDEGVGGIQADHSVDDVSKLTSRIKWLNQFGGLSKKINVDEVIGALYCLGVPQSMSILRGLQERGTSVPDPTRYIKQAVQRANSSMASAKQEKEEDEDDEEGPAEYEEVVEEEADAADGPAQEEIDAAKAEALEASPPEEDVNDIDEDWFDWAAAEQPKRSKKRSNEGSSYWISLDLIAT